MADVKWSQFPSAIPSNSDEVVGLKSGRNVLFSIANIVAAVRNGLANIFVLKSNVGVANGVASLDNNGKVPGTQLDLSGKQSTITASGILKGDGQGGVSAATPGTDYQTPLTIDATPTENSPNPVTSGGVYTAIQERSPVNSTLWSGNSAVPSGGVTISLDDNWTNYAWIVLVLNTASGGQSSSRMVACLPSVAVQYTGYYQTQNISTSGIVRVGRPSGQSAQLILYNINFAALYVTAVFGIK